MFAMKSAWGNRDARRAESSSGRSPIVATISETLSMVENSPRPKAIDKIARHKCKSHRNRKGSGITQRLPNDRPQHSKRVATNRDLCGVKVCSGTRSNQGIAVHPIDRGLQRLAGAYRLSMAIDVINDKW